MIAPQFSVTTNAPNTARWNRYPTNATIPQPPSSFMAPGVAAAAAATTTGNDNNKTTELATFYIHSIFHRSGQLFHIDQPADIPTTPPVTIKRPQYPERRQLSMRMLTPCVLYVQYPCEQKCRNLGICIHYQFVVGCRKCPDGLRCVVCVASGVEEAIQASRRCPLHQDPTQANPIGSRPEDFLATDAQKQVCDQVLARSFACHWDDGPGPGAASVAGGGGGGGVGMKRTTTTAAAVPGVAAGIRTGIGTGTGAGTMVSGYEPAASSSASALHAASDCNMFDREATPQTIQDVMRLQTILETTEVDGTLLGEDIGGAGGGEQVGRHALVEDMASLHQYGPHATPPLTTATTTTTVNRRFFNLQQGLSVARGHRRPSSSS